MDRPSQENTISHAIDCFLRPGLRNICKTGAFSPIKQTVYVHTPSQTIPPEEKHENSITPKTNPTTKNTNNKHGT